MTYDKYIVFMSEQAVKMLKLNIAFIAEVNVEAAAKVFLKAAAQPLTKPVDVLVYSEKGAETSALIHCQKLIGSGKSVFNSLCDTIQAAEEYAAKHDIHRIDVVSADGSVTEKEV